MQTARFSANQCHSRAGGNPGKPSPRRNQLLDSRLRGNDGYKLVEVDYIPIQLHHHFKGDVGHDIQNNNGDLVIPQILKIDNG